MYFINYIIFWDGHETKQFVFFSKLILFKSAFVVSCAPANGPMGVNRSRLSSHTCSLEDRHPILGREYDLSDYTSGLYSVQNGSASHNNSQVYCSYKAQLLDSGGHHVTSGKLELTYSNLIYRFLQDKNLRTVQWPLDGLRGYGCYCNLFTFEAGRRSGRRKDL